MNNFVTATAIFAISLALPGYALSQSSASDEDVSAFEKALQRAIDEAEAAGTGATAGGGAKFVPAPDTGTVPQRDAPVGAADSATQTTADSATNKKAPTPQEIEAARFDGSHLPDGRSALTARLQILLDRAGISPGVVDGWKGGMSESALIAFEQREGYPVDGLLDADVWAALNGDAGPVLQTYTITAEDFADLSDPLPEDYAELAKLDWLGYTSVQEKLAERFHMGEEFISELNPGVSFIEGATITVADPGGKEAGAVARIEIDKPTQRLIAYDASDNVLVNYPVTVGSQDTPSPSGTHTVRALAPEPTYSYDPKNFKQGDNEEFLTLPPGPNGPVGIVWIDLSKPTYGIHGTPRPSKLFTTASHGCVRLTNWDAQELMDMVSKGTVVSFVE